MEGFKKIDWLSKLEVGNVKIDDEHKKLISIYNEMIDILEDRNSNREIVGILTELTNYSLEHFKHEEEWMRKINYPEFDLHQREHKDFIYKIAMFNLGFNSKNEKMVLEVCTFLRGWIINHLVVTDKKIKVFLLEK